MMLEKTERANKNIQEAKIIVNNIDGIFKYFDSLKDLLPQIKESQETDEDNEVNEMLAVLGFTNQRPEFVIEIRFRQLPGQHSK